MKVYLDYAATTPVKTEVKTVMLPFLENNFGNPSSIHSWGQEARGAIDKTRAQVAKFLNAGASEIIFTSGGTEADNLAIRGLITDHRSRLTDDRKPHIITSQIEHHAVLRTCEYLEKTGQAEVTYIKPNCEGIIEVEKIKKAIKKNTVLVSIMYVNNEIGTVQPIREIGKMIEKENKKRLAFSVQGNSKNSKTLNAVRYYPIYFHTDAVQAAEYFPMDVDFLHVDLLTLSGHKIGASKGIGALYIRKGTPIKKILFGGEQEFNLRAGTENVAGIVALEKAIEMLRMPKGDDRSLFIEKTRKLRDYFIDRILKEISNVELNGSKENRSPNNINFYFKYIEGESILLNLDLAGIAASSGSACTSQSLEPSHVITSVYDSAERAHGSIRFTFGSETSKQEIDYTVEQLKKIVVKLRKISPLTPTSEVGVVVSKEKK